MLTRSSILSDSASQTTSVSGSPAVSSMQADGMLDDVATRHDDAPAAAYVHPVRVLTRCSYQGMRRRSCSLALFVRSATPRPKKTAAWTQSRSSPALGRYSYRRHPRSLSHSSRSRSRSSGRRRKRTATVRTNAAAEVQAAAAAAAAAGRQRIGTSASVATRRTRWGSGTRQRSSRCVRAAATPAPSFCARARARVRACACCPSRLTIAPRTNVMCRSRNIASGFITEDGGAKTAGPSGTVREVLRGCLLD
jgi:hypothetical protein